MKTFREALIHSRDTVCVSQQGNTCFAYGGMQCDTTCPAFAAGIKRRIEAHQQYLKHMVNEQYIAGRGIVRISNSSNDTLLIIEIGEYVYDGLDVPVFTCFEKHILPKDIVKAISSLPKSILS